MSFASLLVEDITIVHAGQTVDRYQDTTDDWSTATRVAVKGRLQQTSTTEVTVGRDTVMADWTLFLGADAVIGPSDRVEANGATYEVVGQPAVVYGRAAPHHLEVRLRSVTG